MKRKLPYIIGSVGWIICAIHYIPEYFMYGSDFLEHIAQEEPFLSFSAIAMIPLFMIVGYRLQIEIRTKDKLRESEEKYSTLVKRANDGVVIVQDRIFKFLNERFAEILGYTTEELEGMDFAKILPLESIELAEERYRKRMSGEQVPDIYEVGLLTKNGETVPVEINTAIIEYNGAPADLAYVRDITERKKAEEEIKRGKEFSENLVETAGAVIVAVNLEGNAILCNTKAEEVTGYSKEEIIGKNWLNLVYPDETYRKEVFEVLKSCLEGEQVKAYDVVITRKDGRERILSWDSTLLKDADGKISGVLGIAQDITERKQLEQELKESKDFLANLVQESPTAILSTDSNGNVVVINKSAEELLGYKYDELVGKPLSMAISGQQDLEIAAKKDFLLDFVKKDGTEIPISVSTSVQSFKGEQIGLIVTLKDLSELRGLLITPVSEVGVETEMEYQLEQGFIYIVEEEKPEKSFDVFLDSVKHGSPGLYISRQNPAWIKEKYQLEKTPNIWLTRTKIPEENCISPDELAKLYKTIENFILQADDGVIFFEGLEYLVAQNGFPPVLKFIQSLNDEIMLHPSRLIVAVDPLTLDTKELHILRRDMKTIF